MSLVSLQLVFILVVATMFCASPVCASQPKAKERVKFGEDVILMMTEPPSKSSTVKPTPSASDDSSIAPVPVTTAAAAASTTQKAQPSAAVTAPLQGVSGASMPATAPPVSKDNFGSPPDVAPQRQTPAPVSSAAPMDNAIDTKNHYRLNGRIEQLYANDSVTAPTQAPADVSSGPSASVAGGRIVQSYPANYFGAWTGPVIIDRNDCGAAVQHESATASKERAILHPGRQGTALVVFKMNENAVTVENPIVQFQPNESDRPYLDLLPKQMIPANMHFSVRFGAHKNGTSISGESITQSVTANKITSIGTDSFEQQIVMSIEIANPAQHISHYGTVEEVIDLRDGGPQEMHVNLAVVHYNQAGVLESRMIMHGTIRKKPVDAIDNQN